jgi:hypothetical protein
MGDLIDALNGADEPGVVPDQPTKSPREPGMLLDALSRLTRQAPLHSLTVAFLVGVMVARSR